MMESRAIAAWTQDLRRLVDEWRLMIYPIGAGVGKRCIGDPGKALDVKLVDSRAVEDGVAILIYEPVRD